MKLSFFQHVPLLSAYALIEWTFEAPYQSSGYGFPFDLPHLDFFRRLQEIRKDKRLNDLAANLERDAEVFDRLRQAMRIALPEGKKGLNDDGDNEDMRTIKEKVTEFRKWLSDNNCCKGRYTKMAEQIDKYWEKLFADPLKIVTQEGEVVYIQPQRTNNILERFFRAIKHRNRQKSGTISLSKERGRNNFPK